MDLLAAIKREERKLERELPRLQSKFNGLRAAAKALGDSAIREVIQVKKRALSAAAKAKISRATTALWAKFRTEKSKKARSGLLSSLVSRSAGIFVRDGTSFLSALCCGIS